MDILLAVNEIGGTGWLPLIWVLLFLPFMALWLVTLLLCLGGYEDIDDRGAMVTPSSAGAAPSPRSPLRPLAQELVPPQKSPARSRLSEATVHNLRQASFSRCANSFDAFVSAGWATSGPPGPAQLFVVAYDKQSAHTILKDRRKSKKPWNGVLDEFVADP